MRPDLPLQSLRSAPQPRRCNLCGSRRDASPGGWHPARTHWRARRAPSAAPQDRQRPSPTSTGRRRCSSRPTRHQSLRPRWNPTLRPAAVHWRDLRARCFGPSSSAISPAAASTPTCRMPPPRDLRRHARPRHAFRRAHQHGTHRRAEPLRQAEHYGVEAARQCLHIHAQRHGRIEDARTVEMRRQLTIFRTRPNLLQNSKARHPSTG